MAVGTGVCVATRVAEAAGAAVAMPIATAGVVAIAAPDGAGVGPGLILAQPANISDIISRTK
jgi:hypothetical protein